MKHSKLLILGNFFLGILAHAIGGIDAGGGDSVRCRASNINILEGLYNLDYLLTLPNFQRPDRDVAPVTNWELSRKRILTNLLEKVPELGASFRDYLTALDLHLRLRPETGRGNDSNLRRRVWDRSLRPLEPIFDEGFIRNALPINCIWERYQGGPHGGRTPYVLQTVIRTKRNHLIHYRYDIRLFNELLRDNPLQFSFLAVHEWLWDHTDDVKVQRRVNRFLHLRNFDEMNGEEVKAKLIQLGLKL